MEKRQESENYANVSAASWNKLKEEIDGFLDDAKEDKEKWAVLNFSHSSTRDTRGCWEEVWTAFLKRVD